MAYTFASETVGRGHPDKVADQISDAIVDAILALDEKAPSRQGSTEVGRSRVACETLVRKDRIILAGEINGWSKADGGWLGGQTANSAQEIAEIINLQALVKATIRDIGYTGGFTSGFDADSKNLQIDNLLDLQSAQINDGVRQGDELGAGDQGLMFGYATNECQHLDLADSKSAEAFRSLDDLLMPAPIAICRYLLQQLKRVQTDPQNEGEQEWGPKLGPDVKTQVTVSYDNNRRPIGPLENLVLSTQHKQGSSVDALREWVIEEFLPANLPAALMPVRDQIFVNPAGPFTAAGPAADAGLTGRKIIVDTYGGMARHGGGAFSGKDPTKVDRSAAYAARNIARAIVNVGIADTAEVQLAYAIGESQPKNIFVKTQRSNDSYEHLSDTDLAKAIPDHFPVVPAKIISELDLWRPIYHDTAANGHFGRSTLPWEQEPPASWGQFAQI